MFFLVFAPLLPSLFIYYFDSSITFFVVVCDKASIVLVPQKLGEPSSVDSNASPASDQGREPQIPDEKYDSAVGVAAIW